MKGKSKKPAAAPRKSRFLWITDPWESLDHSRDTTLRLAREGLALGHGCWVAEHASLKFEAGSVSLQASLVTPKDRERPQSMPLSAFDQIHYRVDPPVDLAYLLPLQLLQLGLELLPERSRPELVNAASLIALHSEKTFPTLIAGAPLLPPTCVTTRFEDAQDFAKSFGGRCVLKPLHQAQSKGVELLDFKTAEALERSRELFVETSSHGRHPVLLQEFLEEIRDGEVRLWLLDGKLLAHARKLPVTGDFRVNLDHGSRVEAVRLTAKQKKVAARLGRDLPRHGIRLAAVDLIGDRVTDLNFTSPGMLVELEVVHQTNLAKTVIQALAGPGRGGTSQ